MKKQNPKKKPSRPTLKTLNVGVCLDGDPLDPYAEKIEWTNDRDVFVKNFFKEKVAAVADLSFRSLGTNERIALGLLDVLITHVPPSWDTNLRELCEKWQKNEVIDIETMNFAQYAESLNRVSKLTKLGIPIIAYTKACDSAVEFFERTGLFHAVVRKTGYYKPDCEELKKQALKAAKTRGVQGL